MSLRLGKEIQTMSRSPFLTSVGVEQKLRVSAGILRDAADRILITERLGDAAFAGLWEFPGGKIDAGESAADALCRELAEELGIDVLACTHLMHLDHRYPDRHVSIEFFSVDAWQGQPIGLDGQNFRWQALDELDEATMLPADAPMVRALKELD